MEATHEELTNIAKAVLGIQQLEESLDGVLFGPIPLTDLNGASLGKVVNDDAVFMWASS